MSPAYETLKEYLRKHVSISDEQFEKLSALFIEKKLSKGEIFLKTGDVARYGAFVTNGCLRSYVIDDKGKEHIIQFAPENWWIADQNSLTRKEPAMYYIDAIEDSTILASEETLGEKMLSIVPSMREFSRNLIQNSLSAMQRRLVCHLAVNGQERYEEFIRAYPGLARRLPQHMIASYIGVAPEHLSRIRKEIASHH